MTLLKVKLGKPRTKITRFWFQEFTISPQEGDIFYNQEKPYVVTFRVHGEVDETSGSPLVLYCEKFKDEPPDPRDVPFGGVPA